MIVDTLMFASLVFAVLIFLGIVLFLWYGLFTIIFGKDYSVSEPFEYLIVFFLFILCLFCTSFFGACICELFGW